MKKKNIAADSRKVVKATHDAIVGAAAGMRTLKKRTAAFAKEAEKRWTASKPRRQKAKGELKQAARQAVAFGKDVRQGLKEGFATVRKGKKR